MTAPDDWLARALGYPYPAHGGDFLFRGGAARPLADDHALDGLTPVIAVGSNRAPAQLARKYAGMDVAVPVTRMRARDVDVVHAAHVAGYGAVPATLAASPGTVVELWITWLDEPALERMDATEAVGVNYDRVTVSLAWENAGPRSPARALLYSARRGLLRLDGAPVALAAIPAAGRHFPALSQEQVLRRLHADRGDGRFEDWLGGIVGPPGQAGRNALTAWLANAADRSPCPGIVVEHGPISAGRPSPR
ncbi:MAG: hypothetical protein RLO51_05205 [Thalassobaculum sp.]|uniref:hypothetical protein n=1 Tax=Thalassobaculum sp. TaxID=2022740 RepID=UPI0032EB75BF